MEFLYDHTGVFAVKYDDKTYFYRKDAQANIVALLDNSGSVVVKYKYDAWGKCGVDASTTNHTRSCPSKKHTNHVTCDSPHFYDPNFEKTALKSDHKKSKKNLIFF